MESESNQNTGEEKHRLYREFPFLHYLKGRLIDYVNPETKKRYTGHVAMFYKDTGKVRIDWDNGATTFHDFKEDSKWILRLSKEN